MKKINKNAKDMKSNYEKYPAVKPETTVYFTKKGNDLFVIITKCHDKPIVVEGIGKAKSVLIPGFSGKVKYSALGNKLTIMPPAVSPATIPCNYS